MKKILKKISGILTVVFFAATLLVIAVGTFSYLKNGRPSFGKYQISVIASGSMEPAIKVGDYTITNIKLKITDAKLGDVVCFYDQTISQYVVHRVVDIKEVNGKLTLFLKGDNTGENGNIDEVTEANFYGIVKVTIHTYGVGKFIMKNPSVIFIFIISVFAYFGIREIKNVVKAIKNDEREKLKDELRAELKNNEENNQTEK